MDEIKFKLGNFLAHQLDFQLADGHVLGQQRREARRQKVGDVVGHLLIAGGRD